MNLKKLFILIFSLLIAIGGILGYNYYIKIYKPNTIKEGFLYIPTNSNFEDVQNLVRPFLKRVKPFTWVANKKNYPNTIKPGKYLISKGLNNNELINLLRSGKQTTVKLAFNNQDTFEKLAGRIAAQIEPDSISILNALTDTSFITEAGFNVNTALGMYIPNTYEFYWNTSAKTFRNKMLKEYHKFWNTSRLEKAKNLNLTKNEVSTLASIVQKETANVAERPMVARLYLNRLRDKWPLQADPTIIFALKKELGTNTVIKRVLTKDLNIESPYNTYKNIGLPPGLIAMPDISSIDAVLNPSKHNYYYMCASVTNIGKHEFAKTLQQHNRNASKYQLWLNKQGVNR
ncbi:endolytic transglycosylase MltG [Lutibacter sp.]